MNTLIKPNKLNHYEELIGNNKQLFRVVNKHPGKRVQIQLSIPAEDLEVIYDNFKILCVVTPLIDSAPWNQGLQENCKK